MIIKLRPEPVSRRSGSAGLCWAAPRQWRCCLAHVLGYQRVFLHGASLVTDWQSLNTLQLNTGKQHTEYLFLYPLPLVHHLSWKQDNLLLDFIGLNCTIIFIWLHFYSWHTSLCPPFCPLHPSGKLWFSLYARVIYLCWTLASCKREELGSLLPLQKGTCDYHCPLLSSLSQTGIRQNWPRKTGSPTDLLSHHLLPCLKLVYKWIPAEGNCCQKSQASSVFYKPPVSIMVKVHSPAGEEMHSCFCAM